LSQESELYDILMGFHTNKETTRETVIKAPFGWQGNKFRMKDKILHHLPYRRVYAEPFGGTGNILLNRKVSKVEVYNDRYSGMTDFYKTVADPVLYPQLLDRLHIFVHSRELFLWSRDTWKDCQDPIERAARWFYSIRMSFGKQGRNFGRATKSASGLGRSFHESIELFHSVHRRLNEGGGVILENQDFRTILKDFDSSDSVFYLDPPYFDCWATYEKDLSKAEHVEMLDKIFEMQGFVAVSGYPNETYAKYPWDHIETWEVKEMTNGFAFTESNHRTQEYTTRETVKEALYIKEAA
jgi:DNA adenine methylase